MRVVPSYQAQARWSKRWQSGSGVLSAQADARLSPGAAVLTWPARWRRGIESDIQTQSRDEGNGYPEGLAEMEQVPDSVAAVPHQHQWPAGQPSAELQDHLASPVRELLVGASLPPVISFRGRQHREEGQSPAPSSVAQPHLSSNCLESQ